LGKFRAQFCRQAIHASLKLSAFKPGRSDQLANSQRLLGLIKTVGALSGAVAVSGTGAFGGVMAVCGVGFFSVEEHADKRRTPKTKKLPKIHEPRR
jgi:hypothetical protein